MLAKKSCCPHALLAEQSGSGIIATTGLLDRVKTGETHDDGTEKQGVRLPMSVMMKVVYAREMNVLRG